MRQRARHLLLGILVVTCLFASHHAIAQSVLDGELGGLTSGSFNTLDIAQVSGKGLLNRECLQYCLTGLCIFVNCILGVCTPIVTPRVRHRLPDLLVMAWDARGIPWTEARLLTREMDDDKHHELAAHSFWGGLWNWNKLTGGGSGDGSSRRRSSVAFGEAAVIGSPLAAWKYLQQIPSGICPPATTPLLPYYLSRLDSDLWRGGGHAVFRWIESPDDEDSEWKLTSPQGKRSWGRLYPRTGFHDGVFGPAASAAMRAQRALDIVEEGGLRVRIKTPDSGRDRLSRQERTQQACWQNLHPDESGDCLPLRPSDDPSQTPHHSEDGGYAWLVWSTYSCCIGGKGVKLREVDIGEWCL